MTILTLDKKEFEKRIGRDGKTYKAMGMFNINMFPSDPSGSLDDFYFGGFYG